MNQKKCKYNYKCKHKKKNMDNDKNINKCKNQNTEQNEEEQPNNSHLDNPMQHTSTPSLLPAVFLHVQNVEGVASSTREQRVSAGSLESAPRLWVAGFNKYDMCTKELRTTREARPKYLVLTVSNNSDNSESMNENENENEIKNKKNNKRKNNDKSIKKTRTRKGLDRKNEKKAQEQEREDQEKEIIKQGEGF